MPRTNSSKTDKAPQTEGITIHWASPYDIFSTLIGMGVNSRNSRMVVELARIKPGDKVLDVGCGSGNLTLTAHASVMPGGKVHGIDAAPEMITVARRKAASAKLEVAFDVGLIEQLAFPDKTFDVIISRLAIHHLNDDLKRRGFAEFIRVLKPGGAVLIVDFMRPSSHILGHLASAVTGSHMGETHMWGLPSMLQAVGFTDVACGPTRSFFLGFVYAKKPG